MTMQPGDQIIGGILGGQVDPFQLAPALPHESPLPFVPRYLAKQLWPQGFNPFQPAAMAPAPPVVVAQPLQPANQAAQPAAQPVVAAPQPAAKIIPQPAAKIIPRARDASLHEEIHPTSQRIRISARRGF